MYEKLLTEAEKYLLSHRTKEVPILELWDVLTESAETLNFDMPENLGDFEFLIEADKRFVFVAAKIEEDIEDIDVGEEEGEYEVGEDYFEVEKMEKLGFNQDQVVGLKKFEKKKHGDDDDDDVVTKAKGEAGSPNASTPRKNASELLKRKKQQSTNAKDAKRPSKQKNTARGKK